MSVYAVASGKGGVGKTTTALALVACAGAAGSSAIVVDADLGMADVGTFLGIDDGGPTLHDVLAGDADLDAAIRGFEGFDALPSGTAIDGYAGADPAGLGDVVSELAGRYDVVVLDAGAGLSHDTVLPLGLADEVVLVSTPDEISVLDAGKTGEIVERIGGSLRGVVFTRAVETDLGALADGVDADLIGVIPEDETVREAVDARRPVPAFAPGSPAGTAYMDLAAALFELPVTAISFEDDTDVGPTGIEGAAVEPFSGDDGPADPADEAGGSAADPDDRSSADSDVDTDPEPETSSPADAGSDDADPDAPTETDPDQVDAETDPGDADETDTDGGGSGGLLSRLFGR